MRSYRAVLFDLDGTLTPVPSVWQHIHERLGLWEREALRHQAAFERGDIDYAEFCARDAAHWKGMVESDLRAVTDAIPYRPGARECVGALQKRGLLVGVVSTGLTLLAERAIHDLGLAYAIANRLVARGGVLTGEVKINVEHGRKGEAVDLFCGQFGVDYRDVIAVGDSEGDISMFEHSGFSVAFNPRTERTARSATITHRGESLLDLVDLLPAEPTERRTG
jgi:phosphoserine phosphatase